MDFAALLAVVVAEEDLVVDWAGEDVGTMVLVVLVRVSVEEENEVEVEEEVEEERRLRKCIVS